MAGISMAVHINANTATAVRFASDLKPISFGILIIRLPRMSYAWQRVCNREDSTLCLRNISTNEHCPDVVNHSGRPTEQKENGVKAAGSVMKAADRVMNVLET
jgi:hypothetical protein